jgi:hypothetical protein
MYFNKQLFAVDWRCKGGLARLVSPSGVLGLSHTNNGYRKFVRQHYNAVTGQLISTAILRSKTLEPGITRLSKLVLLELYTSLTSLAKMRGSTFNGSLECGEI